MSEFIPSPPFENEHEETEDQLIEEDELYKDLVNRLSPGNQWKRVEIVLLDRMPLLSADQLKLKTKVQMVVSFLATGNPFYYMSNIVTRLGKLPVKYVDFVPTFESASIPHVSADGGVPMTPQEFASFPRCKSDYETLASEFIRKFQNTKGFDLKYAIATDSQYKLLNGGDRAHISRAKALFPQFMALDPYQNPESNEEVRYILYLINLAIERPLDKPGVVWRGVQHECEYGEDFNHLSTQYKLPEPLAPEEYLAQNVETSDNMEEYATFDEFFKV